MSVKDMAERRQKAGMLRWAPWIVPVLILGLVPSVLLGAAPWWVLIVVALLGAHGSRLAYGVYKKYDQLWAELIREKRLRDGASG